MRTSSGRDAPGHALLIGIDEYPLLPSYRLHGCVHDVEQMERVLVERFAFPADSIRILRDAEASREAILGALDELAARVEPDARVLVHYSGHGSRRASATSPSGWEETLVAADSGRDPDPNRDVADREIEQRLAEIGRRTPYVTLVFDSCFSGSITRGPTAARSRSVPADPRPAGDARGTRGRVGTRAVGPSGWLRPGDRYTLLAACRADEHAFERIDPADADAVNGVLTFHLCRRLRDGAGDGLTYRDLWESVASEVTASFPMQHPQLDGARDRVVLGTRELVPAAFLPIGERRDRRVVLGGGAPHGVVRGSQWAIHPPGTRRPGEAEPLGRARVEAVRAVTAEAELFEESVPSAVAPGCRAFEEARPPGEMGLTVELRTGGEDAARLGELLDRSPLLVRGTARGGEGTIDLHAIAPRERAGSGDPVPQLGARGAATWAAAGPDGLLRVPSAPVGDRHAESRLVSNLERLARSANLREVASLAPAGELAGRLEMTLLGWTAEGRWEEAVVGDGGVIRYRPGDPLGVRVRHRHAKSLHVHLFDLGLTGAVHLLHPPPGGDTELAPGRDLEIGVAPGDELPLFLPPGFPVDPTAPAEGHEHLVLLATPRRCDFSALVQEGVRAETREAAARGGGPLGELLRLALTGTGSRDAPPRRPPPEKAWTALVRSFLLGAGDVPVGPPSPKQASA